MKTDLLSLGLWSIAMALGVALLYCDRWHRRHTDHLLNALREQFAATLKSTVRSRDAQIAQMTESQSAYSDMKTDVDEIALFLREHYQEEINLGYHANRRLGAIVSGYLARERKFAKKGQAE